MSSATSGRPATFSREQAIDRAMHLFWRDGYLAVTASDLAEAMGIQRSSFYNTFGTKESVFAEALQQYVRQSPDSGLEDIRAGQPVVPVIVSMLRELCRVRVNDKEARGCLICNSVAELIGVDKKLGGLLDKSVKQRIVLMEFLFQQAVDQNEFMPRVSVADTARSFVSFLLGVNLVSKSIRSEDELWAICRTFLQGIGIDVK